MSVYRVWEIIMMSNVVVTGLIDFLILLVLCANVAIKKRSIILLMKFAARMELLPVWVNSVSNYYVK